MVGDRWCLRMKLDYFLKPYTKETQNGVLTKCETWIHKIPKRKHW